MLCQLLADFGASTYSSSPISIEEVLRGVLLSFPRRSMLLNRFLDLHERVALAVIKGFLQFYRQFILKDVVRQPTHFSKIAYQVFAWMTFNLKSRVAGLSLACNNPITTSSKNYIAVATRWYWLQIQARLLRHSLRWTASIPRTVHVWLAMSVKMHESILLSSTLAVIIFPWKWVKRESTRYPKMKILATLSSSRCNWPRNCFSIQCDHTTIVMKILGRKWQLLSMSQ